MVRMAAGIAGLPRASAFATAARLCCAALIAAVLVDGPASSGPGTLGPQDGMVDRPAVSEVWFSTAVYGVSSGVLVNAPYIGVAAESFWFIGSSPWSARRRTGSARTRRLAW
jgi:hypothetical protein